MSSVSVISNNGKNYYLDVTQRPKEISSAITQTFNFIKQQKESNWGAFNGTNSYELLNIKEHKLLKTIILQAPKEHKDFYFLDIGAGNFACGNHIAEFINKQNDLPEDIKIHIIGIRGERYLGDKITIDGKCVIYKLGGFKIEKLISRLEKEGLFLRNSINVIVSRWTFRHLVDPVGTFLQAFNLLCPESGFILMDGFFYLKNDEPKNWKDEHSNKLIAQMLIDTKAPFLMQNYGEQKSLNRFILQKPNDRPCELPLNYQNVEDVEDRIQIGSNKITRFRRLLPSADTIQLPDNGMYYFLSGNLKLYNYLKRNHLFSTPTYRVDRRIEWQGPISIDSNEYETSFPYHATIKKKDLDVLEQFLNTGIDINCQDQDGYTLLEVAIKTGNLPAIDFLLSKGANVNTYSSGAPPFILALRKNELNVAKKLIDHGAEVNDKNYFNTPFIDAIRHEKLNEEKIRLLEFLIQNGASCNAPGSDERTPLYHAINVAAKWDDPTIVQFLLENGAIPNEKERANIQKLFPELLQ